MAVRDKGSLAGLTSGKVVIDIRTKEPRRLLLILKVVEETAASMKAQEVTPDFILTFCGGTVPLLKATTDTANDAELAMLSEVRERLADYRARGMVFGACNVADSIFKVKEKQLDPSDHLIGNGLTGYQNKGYAVEPMN
jgi:hypothetical protein